MRDRDDTASCVARSTLSISLGTCPTTCRHWFDVVEVMTVAPCWFVIGTVLWDHNSE